MMISWTARADALLIQACDSEAYCYLPFLEETGYMAKEKYCKSPEIRAHSRRMAEHWNLYKNTLLQTAVNKIEWSDDRHRWICTTDRNDTIVAQFVISAAGPLHKPKITGEGAETFRGRMWHTSRWDVGDLVWRGVGQVSPSSRLV